MLRLTAFKYLSPFILFVFAFFSFTHTGWYCFVPMIYAYILIPFVELFVKADEQNMNAAEEAIAKADKTYDYILYAIVPLQYALLLLFLFGLKTETLQPLDYIGRTMTMGMLCGILGINVAHELGHRANKFEQTLSKILLLSSQYMHFFIDHNKGHHKKVATPEDPSTSRLGEPLYFFYWRTIPMTWVSAWKIEARDLQKAGKPFFSFYNQMLWFSAIQLAFVAAIFLYFGWLITLCYIVAAGLGIGLLETVNYIEHYGLRRKEIAPRKYERPMPYHSWNSNHVIGRLMLFELTRHSDHHYMASRKYQILKHHENSPQMPAGYPGMMILAHIPPLFFYVMKKQREKYAALWD